MIKDVEWARICKEAVMASRDIILHTPWCRILFEKLIVTQLFKNIPPSYGTRRFITVFTKAHHRTLS